MTNNSRFDNASVLDSEIYRDVFSTSDMRSVWSDVSRIQRYLDVERAIAKTQARLKIIPEDAADEIARHCDVNEVDFELFKRATEHIGYPVLPVVQQLSVNCKNNLGRWCQWGATTQDITDTATILQMRAGLEIIEVDLKAVGAELARIAKMHRDTSMVSRSNLQQALPMTFGYKAAVWLSGIIRAILLRYRDLEQHQRA